jgi:hypothetical protein
VDEEAAILEKIVHGDRVDRYKTIRRHKGGQLISVSVTVSPVRDAQRTVVGASTIIQDLSEREAQERRIRELQSELTHVQRLTELGQVVSALVHEVNQPLTALGNYVNACRRLLTSGKQEQLQSVLTKIGDQTDRARESCFSRLSPRSRPAWGSVCQYATRSYRHTADGSGRKIIQVAARFSGSRCAVLHWGPRKRDR